MKFELGKYYKTRGGHKVIYVDHLMGHNLSGFNYKFQVIVPLASIPWYTTTKEGRVGTKKQHELDVVDLWKDKPKSKSKLHIEHVKKNKESREQRAKSRRAQLRMQHKTIEWQALWIKSLVKKIQELQEQKRTLFEERIALQKEIKLHKNWFWGMFK